MILLEEFKRSSPLAKAVVVAILVVIVVSLICGCTFLLRMLLASPEPATPTPAISFVTATPGEPTPVSTPVVFTGWRGEYFDQSNFNNPPVVVRNEPEINYNWGANSPIPGEVPDNNFAVRWTRSANFDSGTYLFQISVEGGVRLWLNGQVLLDSWGEKAFRQVEATRTLDQGAHGLKVEYFKETGNGQIRVDWTKVQAPEPPAEPPLAVINGATRAQVSQPVSFDARSSKAAEGSQLVTFDWDMGDGNRTSGVDVTHTYNSPGVFGVTLTVVDDKGLKDTTSHQIEITEAPATPQPDQPPIAVIVAPSKAEAGQIITFDASQSVSANPVASYAWDLGDGTRVNAVKIQHTYLAPAVYNVTLTVTDNKGLPGTTNKQIEIRAAEPQPTDTPVPTPPPDQPPVAVILVRPSETTTVGETVTFEAGQSVCAGTCNNYIWTLHDGSQLDAVKFDYVYQSSGIFNVNLTVIDDKGLTGQSTQQVTVNEAVLTPEPTAEPTAEPTPEPTTEPTSTPEAGLEDREWRLVGTIEGTVITALFTNGTVSGSSGCNTYSGSYQVEGISLTISLGSMTNQACEQAVMSQETQYLTELQATTSYQVQGNQLTLLGGSAQPLVFTTQ